MVRGFTGGERDADRAAVSATARRPPLARSPRSPALAGYGGADRAARRDVRGRAPASASPCSARTAAARRRCSARCSASCAPVAGRVDAPARCGVVPQTERSRLDFPVSALDVALMGAVSRLPWWRRPGRADRAARARGARRASASATRRDETFGELSGGQRQRVLHRPRARAGRARAAARRAVLRPRRARAREPLMGLLDELAAEGRAMLIATHDVEQARALGPRAVPQRRAGRVRPARASADAADARAHLRRRDRRAARRRRRRRSCRPTTTTTDELDRADGCRSVERAHHAPRARRGRAARRRPAARSAAGSSSTASPTAPSRSRTRCCPGSCSRRSRACRCCSAARSG